MKLYHTSNPKFRDEILKHGLIPQVGEQRCFAYQNDTTPYTFLSEEPWDSTFDDDVYVVDIPMELTENDLNDYPDNKNKWYTTRHSIPVQKIVLIHIGTGNSTL